MAKQHNQPFSLYKRGNIYHAYISFVASSGKRVQSRISTHQILPEKAAQYCLDYIEQIEKQIKLNTGHNEVEISCEEAFVLFFENIGKYHQNAKDTLLKLNTLLKYFNKKLSEITPQDIANYIQIYRNQGKKPSTINRNLTVLSSVINFCRDRNYHTPNIIIAKFKQKEPAENIKYLSDWSIAQKIIDNAAPHLKPIIYTALYTGMRKGNILGLKWDNLDFVSDTINIKVKDKNKIGGKNLSIPIIPQLKEILLQQPKVCEYIFTYKKKPIHNIDGAWRHIFYKRKDQRNFSKELKDPDLPYINFHTLRHTAATWILKATNNLRITQEILGHANIKTTLKYAHVLDGEKRRALNAVFSEVSQNLHKKDNEQN